MKIGNMMRYLELSIKLQKCACRAYVGCAASVFGCGALSFAIAWTLPDTTRNSEFLKPFLGTGATFLSTLSALPLNRYFAKKQRIIGLEALHREARQFKRKLTSADNPEIAELEKVIIEVLKVDTGADKP